MKKIIAFIGLALLAIPLVLNMLYQLFYKNIIDTFHHWGWKGIGVYLIILLLLYAAMWFVLWAVKTLNKPE
jgi:chromate transport protein ChrA